MKKQILIILVLLVFSISFSIAQSPPPPPVGDISELGGPVGVPIDGGALGLIAIGAAIIGKKFFKRE